MVHCPEHPLHFINVINVGAEIAVQRNTSDDDDPLLFQTKVIKKLSFCSDCTGTATVAGEVEAFCRFRLFPE